MTNEMVPLVDDFALVVDYVDDGLAKDVSEMCVDLGPLVPSSSELVVPLARSQNCPPQTLLRYPVSQPFGDGRTPFRDAANRQTSRWKNRSIRKRRYTWNHDEG